ncbi:hypothetical protein FGO68_gene14766 [Halteria grandinella]|uniref:Uncharacterized protein n=1 Tax=Halteria grandinella TaxID=5974 RepID=A0A8J8P0X1_HALGN|nr:hypothetical protein FGO68_gene14766 [Halteria grandinella]
MGVSEQNKCRYSRARQLYFLQIMSTATRQNTRGLHQNQGPISPIPQQTRGFNYTTHTLEQGVYSPSSLLSPKSRMFMEQKAQKAKRLFGVSNRNSTNLELNAQIHSPTHNQSILIESSTQESSTIQLSSRVSGMRQSGQRGKMSKQLIQSPIPMMNHYQKSTPLSPISPTHQHNSNNGSSYSLGSTQFQAHKLLQNSVYSSTPRNLENGSHNVSLGIDTSINESKIQTPQNPISPPNLPRFNQPTLIIRSHRQSAHQTTRQQNVMQSALPSARVSTVLTKQNIYISDSNGLPDIITLRKNKLNHLRANGLSSSVNIPQHLASSSAYLLEQSISGGSIGRSKEASPKQHGGSSLGKELGQMDLPIALGGFHNHRGFQSNEFSMGKQERVSKGISTFTRVVNRETETVLTKLDEASVCYDVPVANPTQDNYNEVMSSTRSEIQQLQQKVSSIGARKKKHQILLLGAPNLISILKDEPYSAQFQFEENPLDLKITIKNLNSQVNKKVVPGVIKFYLSVSQPNPNEKLHDKAILNVRQNFPIINLETCVPS